MKKRAGQGPEGLFYDLLENAGHAVLFGVPGEQDGIFDIPVQIADLIGCHVWTLNFSRFHKIPDHFERGIGLVFFDAKVIAEITIIVGQGCMDVLDDVIAAGFHVPE